MLCMLCILLRGIYPFGSFTMLANQLFNILAPFAIIVSHEDSYKPVQRIELHNADTLCKDRVHSVHAGSRNRSCHEVQLPWFY